MTSLLTHPAIRDLPIGDRAWFEAQRAMIKSKPLVKRCYDLWYTLLASDAASAPAESQGCIAVELGSGSSYIKEFVPEAITSDVAPGVADMVIDGRSLPFPDCSVKAIFLTHVFHHIPDVEQFMAEARRVLAPGGVVSMIECAHTPLGRFFFSKIHPEPYDPTAASWSFAQGSSMLDSNQALSWIVFQRDRARFEALFPDFEVGEFTYLPWLGYLLSGGVNLRSLVPRALTPLVAALDRLVKPLDRIGAIHWRLCIRKKLDAVA